MKANELMVGDWVLNRKKFTEVKPIRLTQVDFCLWKADGIYAKDYLDCDPIPLTQEILKKNGFVNDSYYNECVADGQFVRVQIWAYREENILIDWDGNTLCVVNDFSHPCEDITLQGSIYVHQLQHALRLCGIEKEIAL